MARRKRKAPIPEPFRTRRRIQRRIVSPLREFQQAGQVDFTEEQRAFREMFGGGEQIWGYNDPVHINHDLNPRLRGELSTARLFGMA